MSVARLIKSLENLTENLSGSESNLPLTVQDCATSSEKKAPDTVRHSNFTFRDENKLKNQKKYNHDLASTSNTSFKKKLSYSLPPTHQPSLKQEVKQELTYSLPSKMTPAKLHVIGIPLKDGENHNYYQLSVKEKAEVILEAVHHCIRKIQTQCKLEKQDTVIIQLREYAFEGKQSKFITVEEKNEILKILSQVFPIHFNLILGTGGIAYSIPISLDNHNKINRVSNNYKRIEQQYPQFNNTHLQYEEMLTNERLKNKSATMILHNKNYILTNQYHFNGIDNSKPLSFSKIAPYQETERHHRFSNSMIYNPGQIKENLSFDPNISIHNRTCAEIYYSKLIEPNYHSNLPNLFLVNSASYDISRKTIQEIKKWYCYFFQVDRKKGCQYGIFNTNASDSFYIKFYTYDISKSVLTMADQSPYSDLSVSVKDNPPLKTHSNIFQKNNRLHTVIMTVDLNDYAYISRKGRKRSRKR